ncbi:MAG: protein kinase [Pyrinomonadaceae bacterium]|nr:protein kinase [Pyrinomonadaceae bacterium]
MTTETVIGNYIIGEPIGRGGMGVVYRGRHAKLPREVAIKSVRARGTSDLQHRRGRFQHEAFIQSQLDHHGIVKIYDYIVTEQTYYIVMELVAGLSLAQLLARQKSPLPVERTLNIFEQILAAVIYAHEFVYRDEDGSLHRGIIHCDLKPANIMVTSDDRAKITDFGIVKLVGADVSEKLGKPYGTPQYVSPEQASGTRVDQRSDVYSLGIILYEMLTGAPPFQNRDGEMEEPLTRTEILRAHVKQPPRPPSEVNVRVSPGLEAVVLRALAKEPDNRFPSAFEFLRALRHARGLETPDAKADILRAATTRAEQESVKTFDEQETDHTRRHAHVTQQLRLSSCAACGARVSEDEEQCRQCGKMLPESSSTSALALEEAMPAHHLRRRNGWLAAGLFFVALLGGVLLFEQHRSVVKNVQAQPDSGQIAVPQTATPVPLSSLVELRLAQVEVDSSFDAYNSKPLTDGVTDVRSIAALRYNEGNWAAAETPAPHWIEINLERPTRVASVYIYWGFDHARFLPSRHVELQMRAEDKDWRTISSVDPGEDFDRVAFEFAPVLTKSLRILQPAMQGPRNRPFVMWVREIKVFGLAEDSKAARQ